MAEEVQIIIEAINKATAQLKEVENSVLSLSQKTNESNTAFSSAANSVLGYLAAFATIGTAISFLKSATEAAIEQETAQARLKFQVGLAGVSWDKYGGIIDAVVQRSSDYAHVQDNEVSDALQRLILITGDVRGSTENLNLVLDLAKAKNIDYSTAADIVGKAMGGNLIQLQRMLPEMKNVADRLGENATLEEKSAAAIEFLTSRTKEFSAAMPGVVNQLSDMNRQWEHFKEAVGGYITFAIQNWGPALLSMLSKAGSFMEDLMLLFNKGWIQIKLDTITALEFIINLIPEMLRPGFVEPFIASLQEIRFSAESELMVVNSAFSASALSMQAAAAKIKTAIDTSVLPSVEKMTAGITFAANISFPNMAVKASNSFATFSTQVDRVLLPGMDRIRGGLSGVELSYNNLKTTNFNVLADIDKAENIAQQARVKRNQEMAADFQHTMAFIASSALSTNRHLFVISRAAAVGQAIQATYLAATKALAATPWPPANMAFAAIVTAAGLANVARIVSAPPPMAEGGIVTRPTMALIGEAGPEAVIPLSRTDQMMNSPIGQPNITITFTGPVLGDPQQAKEFAFEIDRALYDLRIRNQSLAFS